MNYYIIDVDITMSKRLRVNAENEEDAKKFAREMILSDPYYLASKADGYVCHEITDIYKED